MGDYCDTKYTINQIQLTKICENTYFDLDYQLRIDIINYNKKFNNSGYEKIINFLLIKYLKYF